MKKIYTLIVLALVLSASATQSWAQTTVPNIISSNQVWNAAGSPYQITGTTLISEGYTVTIMPGVTVEALTPNLKIIVDGELKAMGKKDSVITFDRAVVGFTTKSVDYDSATGTGSQFNYSVFDASGSTAGIKTIDLSETSMLVRNCKFVNAYYCIYSYGYKDTTSLYLENSIFVGLSSNYGYPVYASGNGSVRIADCYFYNMGSLSPGQNVTILRSTFDKFAYSRGIMMTNNYKNLYAECNVFKNFRYTVFDLGYPTKDANIYIANNTFDSNDVHISGYYYVNDANSFVAKNNNFLSYKSNSVKFSSSKAVGTSDTLNFQNNYWGSTSSSDISAGIKDFTDDIAISTFVDFSGQLSAMVTSCPDGSTIGDVDTSNSTGSSSVMDLSSTNWNVYPNPANATVKVDIAGKMINSVTVFELSGRMVQQINVNDIQASFDVSALKNGIYIIQVNGVDAVYKKQIIVAH